MGWMVPRIFASYWTCVFALLSNSPSHRDLHLKIFRESSIKRRIASSFFMMWDSSLTVSLVTLHLFSVVLHIRVAEEARAQAVPSTRRPIPAWR